MYGLSNYMISNDLEWVWRSPLLFETRDVKFVFFPNSNFVCKIRILFELRLGLRCIMVSSVHHYHGTQVPVCDKNECIRLAMQSESTYVLKTKALYKLVNNNSLSSVFSDLKLQKAKKTVLFTNKIAVTIDHVIALLFNVSSRLVPCWTYVASRKSVSYRYSARKEQIHYRL